MAFPPRRVRHWPAVWLPIALIAACRSPVRELADTTVSEQWTRSYPLSENGNVIVFTRDGSV
jgi:hypothetical protein